MSPPRFRVMAAERVVRSALRDLECAVCKEPYAEPCTLPCGHNFCRRCITSYWDRIAACKCLICQREFPTRPELSKNTDLAALVEALQAQEGYDDCSSCTGPGAVQLCLPCKAPLCQEHLSRHSDDSTGKRHLLVSLQTATCPEHRRSVISAFCVAHSAPVCPECALHRHPACHTEPLMERYCASREYLEKTIKQLDTEISRMQESITRQKHAAHQVQSLICNMRDTIIQDFRVMRNHLELQERACLQLVQREQEKVQQAAAQDFQLLEPDADLLKKLKLELQDRVANDWLAVLKGAVPDIKARPTSLPNTLYTFDENLLTNVTEAISSMKKSLLVHPLLEPILPQPEDATVSSTTPLGQACDGNFSESGQNLQWATSLQFDPETVNCRLQLSEDLRTVMVTSKNFPYQKSERRFGRSQVMCSECFSSDCHYWEISTAECDGWAIGVAAADMERGDQLGRNAFSWCLEWNKDHLCYWHQKELRLSHPRPLMVGVLLNCPKQHLTFYSVSANGPTIIHTCQVQISSPLFPAVWLFGLKPGNSLTIRDLQRLTV